MDGPEDQPVKASSREMLGFSDAPSKMIHLLFLLFTKVTWQIRFVFEVFLDLNDSSLCE